MRLVDEAERAPRRCAVTGRPNGPFIDFQVECRADSPNIPNFLYLHKGIVEEAARKLGMVPAAEVQRLTDQLAELKTELDDAREDMRVFAEFEERFKERSVPA